jgi:hypothetical protein
MRTYIQVEAVGDVMSTVRRVVFLCIVTILIMSSPQALFACNDCSSDPDGYSVCLQNPDNNGEWADCQNGQKKCWCFSSNCFCQPYCGSTRCMLV